MRETSRTRKVHHCDIIRQESGDRARVVTGNGEFLSILPFAPRFPLRSGSYRSGIPPALSDPNSKSRDGPNLFR